MTAPTMPARPWKTDAGTAAGAVAAAGLGHLAAAPLRAGRRGRPGRRPCALPVACWPSAAPRLRRRAPRLPPGQPHWAARNQGLQRRLGPYGPTAQTIGDRADGGALADRGLRRRTGAGPGTGDRHLPVCLDSGRQRATLDARQAGTDRGHGDGPPPGLLSLLFSWYYQPLLHDGQRASRCLSSFCHPAVWPARGRVRRVDAGRLHDRRPGRAAHPPCRPGDRGHPGRLRRV